MYGTTPENGSPLEIGLRCCPLLLCVLVKDLAHAVLRDAAHALGVDMVGHHQPPLGSDDLGEARDDLLDGGHELTLELACLVRCVCPARLFDAKEEAGSLVLGDPAEERGFELVPVHTSITRR